MKIKRKKQLNLPQLIEWISTDIDSYSGLVFRPLNRGTANYILIHPESLSVKFNGMIFVEDTFTVEVEEEITEDTKLDLIERFIGGMDYACYTSHTMSIKECLKRSPSDCTTTHFYIENDNRELVLIWRDGKLI